ncbi:MAG: hypothetical protein JXQ27_12660 [Acidobacteria bacterium]|nr:hypothetical protein [Acidobacteriota bacterium]
MNSEHREKKRKKQKRVARLVYMLSPFIGFLFSTTKLRIEDRTGLDPVFATRYSIMLEGGLVAVFLSQIFVNQLGGGRPPFQIYGLDMGWLGLLLFLPDVSVRLLRLLDQSADQFGFYEWVFRIFRRRRRR